MKKIVLEEISSALSKWGTYVDKYSYTTEVAEAFKIAEKLGVRVGWIDRLFGEIEKKKMNFELAKQFQLWKPNCLA